MSDRERVCVQCGSPGREERFSCDECGGTIVETEAAQAVTVPAAPPPRSGSGNWAPPGYSTVDPEWDAPAVTPPEHPVRRAFRVRTKRAIAVATLMSLVVAAGVVTIGVLVVQTFAKEPTPISKDMRGYAGGQGARYATKSFEARLPAGYHKNNVTLRLSNGTRMRFTVASASNGVTALVVASAPVSAKLANRMPGEAQTVATQIDAQMSVGAANYSIHEHRIEGNPAWDITAKTAIGPSAAVRVILYPREIVVLAAGGAMNLPGDLKALETSYRHA